MKLSDQITRRHLFVAFGTSSQTGSLSSVDLAATRDDASVALTASDGSVAPIAGADASAAGVMTAADKIRLDNLPPTTTREFGAFAAIPATQVAAAITHLRTAGYAGAGDGGGALFRRVAAEPSHAFKVQSLDGAWWEGVPAPWGVSVHQFGAVGDDPGDGTGTDDTAAIQAALDYAQRSGGLITKPVWFEQSRKYRVSNLTVTDMRSLVLRSTGGASNNGESMAALVFAGTAGTTLLHLQGVVYGIIEGIAFLAGSTSPDAYIKTDNGNPGWVGTSLDLDHVLIDGGGKTDGAVGIDFGPNSTTNNSDTHARRLDIRNIQTGVRFNNPQVVGHKIDYLRGVGCGTLLDVVDGGNFKIGFLNCTGNDLDVKVRGSGGDAGTFQIDNAHVEQSSDNPAAVFLDVASTGTGGIIGVLNNPIVQFNYSGTPIKVGQAATVVCHGGVIRNAASVIDLSGTEDQGDAVFLGVGTRFGGSFATNDWGYYRLMGPMFSVDNFESPFGGHTIRNNGAKVLGHDREKMPTSRKQYFTMPIHRPGGATVKRVLPAGAVVTGIDVLIEGTGTANDEKFKVIVGGVDIATFAAFVAGARHLGVRVHDLDASDTSHVGLGDPTVLSGLDSTSEVKSFFIAGQAAEFYSITGQIVVEYVVESVQATGIDP